MNPQVRKEGELSAAQMAEANELMREAARKLCASAFTIIDNLLNDDECFAKARACIEEPSPCGSKLMDHGEFINVLYRYDIKEELKNLGLKKNDLWPIAVRVMRSVGFRISKGIVLEG